MTSKRMMKVKAIFLIQILPTKDYMIERVLTFMCTRSLFLPSSCMMSSLWSLNFTLIFVNFVVESCMRFTD